VTAPMRFLVASLLLLTPLVTQPTRADVYVPHVRVDPVPTINLVSVDYRASSDAPQADTSAVTGEVQARLQSLDARIDQCIGRADLREDPLRSRTRRMIVVLRFSRSSTPQVSVERGGSMPAVARRCVVEAARSVRSSTVPRGDVTIRAVYELY
jgi:hypothetical protein